MAKKRQQTDNSLMIVAIVAIVSVVVLIMNSGAELTVFAGESGNIAGQAGRFRLLNCREDTDCPREQICSEGRCIMSSIPNTEYSTLSVVSQSCSEACQNTGGTCVDFGDMAPTFQNILMINGMNELVYEEYGSICYSFEDYLNRNYFRGQFNPSFVPFFFGRFSDVGPTCFLPITNWLNEGGDSSVSTFDCDAEKIHAIRFCRCTL